MTWYDGFGQPTTALLNMAGESRYVSYQHDEAGNRVRITHPDGAAFGFGHDSLGRTTMIHDHSAPTSLDDYIVRYWYKPEGPRHAAVRGAGTGGFTTVSYYDALLRPEGIHNDLSAAGADVSLSFGYNRAGQIVSRTVSNDDYAAPPAANADRGYKVNGLNQYVGTTWAGAPNWSFEHDPNGNLKRSIDPAGVDSTSFVYDVENRLVSASGKANATLVYDPLGRLFEVSSPNGPTTRFLYDGDRMIAEYDPGSRSGAGSSGTLLKRYVHGPGTDEPVAVYYGEALGTSGRRYMLPDERGSIVALVGADGSPAAKNRYDPWGVPPMGPAGSTNEGRFQYTGQAWIPELGLYYYKARFYSPFLGRFMQVDPIGYEDQMNLYAYGGNDPMNKSDPSGKATFARPGQEDEIARRINNLTRARYAFTGRNGALRQVGEAPLMRGSRLRETSYYDNRIKAAISSSKSININIADKVSDPISGEISITDRRVGGGATYTKDNGDQTVAVARGGVIATTDTKGNPLVQSSAELLMHELVVHAIPNVTGVDVGRGLDNENRVREEVGMPLRAPDPVSHPYENDDD